MRNYWLILLLVILLAIFVAFASIASVAPAPVVVLSAIALLAIGVAYFSPSIGLYLLIFSFLLSPEFTIGGGGATISEKSRPIVIRAEDILLVVLSVRWLMHAAINKDVGLILKGELNVPIFIYIGACALSTALGYVRGNVKGISSIFFLLKYIEYFFVLFIFMNHIRSGRDVRSFIYVSFLVCFIVSLYGIYQIPKGIRVSAPFEGKVGEPNTFGGYLVFMMALMGGFFVESSSKRVRILMATLIGFAFLPFIHTLSRSSYLAFAAVVFSYAFLSKKKLVVLLAVLLIIGLAVMFPNLVPEAARDRVMSTFYQPPEKGQLLVGGVRVDTSASARLMSWQYGLKHWLKRPFFGYGVTGFVFMDAQFIRTLCEAGIVGLSAFLFMLYRFFAQARQVLDTAKGEFYRGLALGYMVGLIGLSVHALGANTFIIIRIMEPFYFVTALVLSIPRLQEEEAEAKLKEVEPEEEGQSDGGFSTTPAFRPI